MEGGGKRTNSINKAKSLKYVEASVCMISVPLDEIGGTFTPPSNAINHLKAINNARPPHTVSESVMQKCFLLFLLQLTTCMLARLLACSLAACVIHHIWNFCSYSLLANVTPLKYSTESNQQLLLG